MRRATPALLSLIMFLVVGGLIALYIGKTLWASDEPEARVAITTIPMALADLEPGTTLSEAHIGLGKLPADQVTPDMLLTNRVLLGRVVKKKIEAGEPFRPDFLFAPGVRPPLDVAEGMRAVSVEVDGSSGIVDGLISPGQFVDAHLTVTGNSDPRLENGLTLTLFKGVQVLAMNGAAGMSRGQNTVTLELTPMQANVMILAQDRGKLTLTYNPDGRGTGVVAVPNEDRATLEQILGLRPIPPVEPPFRSEHFSGASRNVMEWQDGRRTGGFGSGSGNMDGGADNTPRTPVNSMDGPAI